MRSDKTGRFMIVLKNSLKKKLCWLMVGLYCLAWGLWLEMPDGRFHLYFLDIGQGDGTLVVTPENHQILIDGGPGNAVLEELAEVMPFFDKSMDMLVLTHPHADHLEGLVEVLKRYEVEMVLLSGATYKNSAYEEFLREIDQEELEVQIAVSDQDFRFGDVYFDVIYPLENVAGREFENVNNSSVAMRISVDNKKILLTGDLEVEAEEELLKAGVELKADIYQAGHHGSRTASSPAFLAAVDPAIVVIQCGVNNSYGHPHPETLRALARQGVKKIYRNDLDGRVEFSF